ncbi:MAG: 4Fe-4S dicluster domain-containing protein [Thermodesulfobacteriota bacterium]
MMRVGATATQGLFLEEVSRLAGVEIAGCYQCGKCSAGCPMADEMDILPNQVLRLIQLNAQDELLAANGFWRCVSCQTCSSRCPKGIDAARVMDTLKILAVSRGWRPKDRLVAILQRLFLANIRRHGRLQELELAALFNLRSFRPFQDIRLVPKLHARGKLSLARHETRDIHSVQRIFELARPFDRPASTSEGHRP